jgi:hypothetical protein
VIAILLEDPRIVVEPALSAPYQLQLTRDKPPALAVETIHGIRDAAPEALARWQHVEGLVSDKPANVVDLGRR